MRGKLFARRRDGRVEVRLNDGARAFVREVFGHVVAAERDPEHEWRSSLNAPINPSRDVDDPLATLARERDVASNAELAVMTLREPFLSDAEAWAWFCTLQVALRSIAVVNGLLSDEKLAGADPDVLDEIHAIQQLLFDLSACW